MVTAAERARAAQARWARTGFGERAAVFLRFHDLVLEHRDTFMDLIQWENGKARRDAFLEVADVANTARYYARTAARTLAPSRRTGLIPGLTEVHELHHPRGVVTIISPWNYPPSLGVGDTIPALMAGNAVVQKADNQTALTALFALDLARRAGLPDDLWQIVLGRGSAIGTPLLDIADYVMFTGSTGPVTHIATEDRRRRSTAPRAGRQERHGRPRRRGPTRTVEGGALLASGQLCIHRADAGRRGVRPVRARVRGGGPVHDHQRRSTLAQMGTLTSAEQLGWCPPTSTTPWPGRDQPPAVDPTGPARSSTSRPCSGVDCR